MDATSEHPIGNFSAEKALFKDLAGLLHMGVEELNRRSISAHERMPEIKANAKTSLEAVFEKSETDPAVSRSMARGLQKVAILLDSGAIEGVRLSTSAIIKAREIFGRKKE